MQLTSRRRQGPAPGISRCRLSLAWSGHKQKRQEPSWKTSLPIDFIITDCRSRNLTDDGGCCATEFRQKRTRADGNEISGLCADFVKIKGCDRTQQDMQFTRRLQSRQEPVVERRIPGRSNQTVLALADTAHPQGSSSAFVKTRKSMWSEMLCFRLIEPVNGSRTRAIAVQRKRSWKRRPRRSSADARARRSRRR